MNIKSENGNFGEDNSMKKQKRKDKVVEVEREQKNSLIEYKEIMCEKKETRTG